MALPKPENQPYTIFRVHNKQKKLSVCMENNSDIVCGMRHMMNDTPITGKSTSCCNISITQQTNKEKKNYLFAWKTILRLFYGVRPIKNDTPNTGKSTLCHNILISQQTKIFVLHGKLFIREQVERLREALMGYRVLAPDGVARGSVPLPKKIFYHTIK